MMAGNQPWQHTGLVGKSGCGQTSPIVNICKWPPMSESVERDWSGQSCWNQTFRQRSENRFLPILRHMVAECGITANDLVRQVGIPLQFQLSAIPLWKRVHWIYVHWKHLFMWANSLVAINKQRSKITCLVVWFNLCSLENLFLLGLTKCENEVRFWLQVPKFTHHWFSLVQHAQYANKISTTDSICIQSINRNVWSSIPAALSRCTYASRVYVRDSSPSTWRPIVFVFVLLCMSFFFSPHGVLFFFFSFFLLLVSSFWHIGGC